MPFGGVGYGRRLSAVYAADGYHDISAGIHFSQRNVEIQHSICPDSRMELDGSGHDRSGKSTTQCRARSISKPRSIGRQPGRNIAVGFFVHDSQEPFSIQAHFHIGHDHFP